MTDNEALIDRIRQIIEQKGLTLSSFAEQIGSNRPVITHILNGRNNPSLEIIKKILGKYEDINSEWLLFGREPMFRSEKPIIKSEKSAVQTSLFDDTPELTPKNEINPANDTPKAEYRKENEVKPVVETPKPTIIEEIIPKKQEYKKISKIMIFYSDNTFDSLTPDAKPFE